MAVMPVGVRARPGSRRTYLHGTNLFSNRGLPKRVELHSGQMAGCSFGGSGRWASLLWLHSINEIWKKFVSEIHQPPDEATGLRERRRVFWCKRRSSLDVREWAVGNYSRYLLCQVLTARFST